MITQGVQTSQGVTVVEIGPQSLTVTYSVVHSVTTSLSSSVRVIAFELVVDVLDVLVFDLVVDGKVVLLVVVIGLELVDVFDRLLLLLVVVPASTASNINNINSTTELNNFILKSE